jgi:hypothetical protein
MHHWCSIVEGGRDMVTSIFANQGFRLVHRGLSAFHSGCIIQETSATIVYTPLTLILGLDYDVVLSIINYKGSQL